MAIRIIFNDFYANDKHPINHKEENKMDAKNVVTETAEAVEAVVATPVVVPEMTQVSVPQIEVPKTSHVWGYVIGGATVAAVGLGVFGIYKLVNHIKTKKEAKNATVEEDQAVED